MDQKQSTLFENIILTFQNFKINFRVTLSLTYRRKHFLENSILYSYLGVPVLFQYTRYSRGIQHIIFAPNDSSEEQVFISLIYLIK